MVSKDEFEHGFDVHDYIGGVKSKEEGGFSSRKVGCFRITL
jgi:hypothetical protein